MTFTATGRRLRLVTLLCLALMLLSGLSASNARGTTVPDETTPTSGDETGGSEVSSELPPPDLPSSNVEGYTFDLQVSLRADLDTIPREASVYEVVRDEPTKESVEELANQLGIGGEVEDRGDGSFTVSGEGELFVTVDLIQYFSTSEAAAGELPSDEAAVTTARDWLRQNKLLAPDVGDGKVAARIAETNRMIVVFTPVEPKNLLAAYPSMSVTVGVDGVVLEAAIRWGNIVRADVYQLMPIEQAWQQVQSGQAYLAPQLEEAGLAPGTEVSGRASFSTVTVAYSTSGPPGGRQYLQPIYVFDGRIRVEGIDDKTFLLTAYVPALANSGAPVGLLTGAY